MLGVIEKLTKVGKEMLRALRPFYRKPHEVVRDKNKSRPARCPSLDLEARRPA
jgi:hypothetical protein